uniref:Nuclear receptor n=1 Tax=Parastrongyloides trichosuri TaxID=131310 RepID=A0A0N4ZXH2_PARTI
MSSDHQCKVCHGLANGIHNKCRSCRACAAFFKRAVAYKNEFKCKTGKYDCNITPNNLFCKACRFIKCKEAGMELTRREKNIMKSFKRNNSDIKTTYDFESSLNHVSNIFNKGTKDYYYVLFNNKSILQRISQQYNILEETLQMKNHEIITEISNKEIERSITFSNKCLVATAEMLMNLPEFYILNNDLKMLYFKKFYPIWYVFFLITRTVQIFNEESIKSYILIDENGFLEMKPSTDGTYIDRLFEKINNFYVEFLLKNVGRLNLSSIEVGYIILQILWSKDPITNISVNDNIINNKILAMASDELHEYYVNIKKMDNYVDRLTEIIKLIAYIQQFNNTKNNGDIINSIFNVMHYNTEK